MDVRVLGPFAIVRDGEPVDLKGLRQRAVLAVLLIEAGRVVSTDRLADLVWDGAPPEQAQTSLQAYVSKLRRALEPDRDGRGRPWQHLLTRDPGYVLELDPADIDAWRFEQACDDGLALLQADDPAGAVDVFDRALDLWHGDPYADFSFSGFARNEIARLLELRWRAIEDRSDARLALGRHREVIAELDGLVRGAPLRERLRGQLVLALYRSGRQADALACLAEGREALVEELGLDPGPELQRLEQDILQQDPALDHQPAASARPPVAAPVEVARATGPSRPPMVGRDDELARAADLIARARDGRGGLALVMGEAGIGKTRLAEETAAVAEAAGVTVVWGRCPELEGAPPFWPWTQVLRSLGAAEGPVDPLLHALVPELAGAAGPPRSSPGDSDGGLFQLYDAVGRFLADRAAERPLLVVLEDLHWADAASLRLLRFLAGVGPAGRFSLLATSREGAGATALHELQAEAARADRIDVLPLPHLDRRAIESLVTTMTGDAVSRSTVEALLERSGGNPFFVGELVRLGGAGAEGIPAGVRDVVRRRVEQLDERVQRLLTVASCCPDDFALDAMAAVLDVPLAELVDDVDAALAARLLHEVSDRPGHLRFSHPLVRDAVNDPLSSMRRAQLHLALATALAPEPDRPVSDERVAQLAHHYRQAAPLGTSAEAVRWGYEAGRRDLARWAAEDAEAAFQQALDVAVQHGGIDDATIVDLLTGLGRARRFLGEGTSREVLRDAIDLARKIEDPRRIVLAALATAEGAWGLGSTFGTVDLDLVEALEWAIDRLDPSDAALQVAGRAYLACGYVFADDESIAPRQSAQALADARAIGNPRLIGGALIAHYATTWSHETVAERAELLAELAELVHEHGFDRDRLQMLRWIQALEHGDIDAAQEVLAQIDVLLAEGPRPSLSMLQAWRRSLRAALDGEFAEAERLIFEAHELLVGLSQDEAVDATGGQLALVYWLWHRLDVLVPMLEIAMDEQPYMTSAFGPVLALAHVHAGEPDRARAVLDALGLEDRTTLPTPMLRSGTVSAYAACCVDLADPERAATALRLLGDASSAPTVIDHVGVFYLGARDAYRGMLLLVLGEVDEAVAALERGLAVDERVGGVVFVLRDQLHLADALRRRQGPGDLDRAVALATAARATADRLELEADRAWADGLLATLQP